MLYLLLLFHCFIVEQHFIIWIYHILSIHSPGAGLLDCFHFWGTMNYAAVNTYVRVLCTFSMFFGYILVLRIIWYFYV